MPHDAVVILLQVGAAVMVLGFATRMLRAGRWYRYRFRGLDARAFGGANSAEILDRLDEQRTLVSQLLDDVGQLNDRMVDLEERLDFTERILTQHRAAAALPEPEHTPTPV